MVYIILILIFTFFTGIIVSSWITSKTIFKQENLINEYQSRIISLDSQIVKLQENNGALSKQLVEYINKEKSYPTYSSKV